MRSGRRRTRRMRCSGRRWKRMRSDSGRRWLRRRVRSRMRSQRGKRPLPKSARRRSQRGTRPLAGLAPRRQHRAGTSRPRHESWGRQRRQRRTRRPWLRTGRRQRNGQHRAQSCHQPWMQSSSLSRLCRLSITRPWLPPTRWLRRQLLRLWRPRRRPPRMMSVRRTLTECCVHWRRLWVHRPSWADQPCRRGGACDHALGTHSRPLGGVRLTPIVRDTDRAPAVRSVCVMTGVLSFYKAYIF
mmetsp:Transcript_29912/g.71094  ORF Transcript_29912/g.71094 Transcript_29912/m.71094 type:complete len:242 (+) Transcript_29912:553-1278(+)